MMPDIPDGDLQDDPDNQSHDEAWKFALLAQRKAGEVSPENDEGGADNSALLKLAAAHAWRCWYCGCQLTPPTSDASIKTQVTRDHVVPRSKGGSSRSANLVAACRGCNNAKRAKSLEEYRATLQANQSQAVIFFGERQS